MTIKQYREMERQAEVVTLVDDKLKELKCVDGLYYIGDLIDVDGNPWVERDQAIEIIRQVNKKY